MIGRRGLMNWRTATAETGPSWRATDANLQDSGERDAGHASDDEAHRAANHGNVSTTCQQRSQPIITECQNDRLDWPVTSGQTGRQDRVAVQYCRTKGPAGGLQSPDNCQQITRRCDLVDDVILGCRGDVWQAERWLSKWSNPSVCPGATAFQQLFD